jgi:hypothetical protein
LPVERQLEALDSVLSKQVSLQAMCKNIENMKKIFGVQKMFCKASKIDTWQEVVQQVPHKLIADKELGK